MNCRTVHRISFVFLPGLTAFPAFGLTITSVSPGDYQTAALATGASVYADAGGTVGNIPLALNGGSLIRTLAADADNSALAVSFNVDVRAEVYVCYDSRTPPPAWLNVWVNTGMTVDVNNGPIGQYNVYAKRFPAGTVNLSNNGSAAAMYFVVVQSSLPAALRNGWVLLSYDMPYLRDIVKQAPLYSVNHIQLSHDIMMMPTDVLDQSNRRANVNEIIDLAHAYGVTEVCLWTHEVCTIDMPGQYYAGDGRVDGDNPGLWDWMYQRYVTMFTAGPGCPEADALVLTFDEISMFNQGVEVYNRNLFKHNCCSPTQSEAKVINIMQQACAAYGKMLYVRTWGYQNLVRDAIVQNGDPAVWMMPKNVGDSQTNSLDWQYMDTYNPIIGTLPAGYKELVEFDLCGEYLGRGRYTFAMTSYLKDHWNDSLNRSAGMSGLASRIDRVGSLPYYGSNRLSLYAQQQVLANPNADPAAINLAWAQQNFPAESAQDVANSYDAPGSAWDGDTRYMTWEDFASNLSPVSNTQARTIATTALTAIDGHRAQLENQIVLDTRDGKTDYDSLRNGIALALLDLGGTLPTANGFSNLRPMATNSTSPDCLIDVRIPSPGLKISTVTCEYSTDGGIHWTSRPATTLAANGSTNTETITAAAVPFNQLSDTANFIRYTAKNTNNLLYSSGALRVITVTAPTWGTFAPAGSTHDLTPDCAVTINTSGEPLDPATARYTYSIDGGANWIVPQTGWQNQYDCNQLPAAAGWTLIEGHTGYESISAGVLRINDTSTASGDKVKYAKSWSVNSAVGATVLARMKCASGGHPFASNIGVADALHSESIYLKGSGIVALAGYNAMIPITTNVFHTYRVTIRNTDFNVYLDENPKPFIRANGAFIQGPGGQQLVIGSGASAATQDIYYDYVYWTTAGAFAPGQWFEAGYTGGSQAGTLTASSVPFNQVSDTQNQIRFQISDTLGLTYTSPIYTVQTLTGAVWADFDFDGDVDQDDFSRMQRCYSGAAVHYGPGCSAADADGDGDVDDDDFYLFTRCLAGANASPACAK